MDYSSTDSKLITALENEILYDSCDANSTAIHNHISLLNTAMRNLKAHFDTKSLDSTFALLLDGLMKRANDKLASLLSLYSDACDIA